MMNSRGNTAPKSLFDVLIQLQPELRHFLLLLNLYSRENFFRTSAHHCSGFLFFYWHQTFSYWTVLSLLPVPLSVSAAPPCLTSALIYQKSPLPSRKQAFIIRILSLMCEVIIQKHRHEYPCQQPIKQGTEEKTDHDWESPQHRHQLLSSKF